MPMSCHVIKAVANAQHPIYQQFVWMYNCAQRSIESKLFATSVFSSIAAQHLSSVNSDVVNRPFRPCLLWECTQIPRSKYSASTSTRAGVLSTFVCPLSLFSSFQMCCQTICKQHHFFVKNKNVEETRYFAPKSKWMLGWGAISRLIKEANFEG